MKQSITNEYIGSGAYRIISTKTGLFYIGSSYGISGRFKQHKAQFRSGKHTSSILQEDWFKYGEESFVFEVLSKDIDKDKSLDSEQKFLDEANGNLLCVNISSNARGYVSDMHTGQIRNKRNKLERSL